MIRKLAVFFVAGVFFASCVGESSSFSDQIVDIGSHRLQIHQEGKGAPTVVIDAGITDQLDKLRPLQERIAGVTHIITYNRAGYGQSEPGPVPRHSGREAEELKALLEKASIPGPYVLVGHSLGALNMQVFASKYPDDVAGMVLLDPPPLSFILREEYRDLGAMADRMTAEWQAIADSAAQSADAGERARSAFFGMIASEHREMFGETARLVAAISTFGDIPLVVMAAGRPNPAFGEAAEDFQKFWIAQSRALAGKSSNGKFILAERATHYLYLDEPDLVAESILSVVHVAAKDPVGAAAFDGAIDKLFAEGYPQGLVTYFCSLGTNPDLGFRWAGTSAERAVGDRVAAEMRAMGLSNVRLEPVPVDVFEFEKASVAVNGRMMAASTIAGVPPTPEGGITARVVYVKGGTASDFDAAGDVAGKLVLVDAKMTSWWFTWPAFEAGHRKAAGVVCTYTPEDPKYYSINDQALGSFDGQYDLAALPWVYISRADGDWIKSRLEAGPVTATMVLKEKVTLERDGGVAYNVIGELPGERRDGQMVLMSAHQDAHFRAGVDDTAALANMLTVAKAMRASGHRPKTTVVFLATAGEEFGYTNAYYEWLTGAWWAAARAHKDWAGRVRAMLNLESMAVKEAPLTMRSNPELKPWLERLASRCSVLLPYGSEAVTPVNSWNDQWPFTAAGIPSVEFATYSADYDRLYHSNFETSALVDWAYLAKIAKFAFRAAQQLDDGLLPYSLEMRAADFAAAVNKEEMLAAGANTEVVSRLVAGVSAFRTAAADFDARAGAIPVGRTDAVNKGLLEVEKAINSGLTALSPADDDATVYPHQAVLRDAQGINAALAALKADRPDPAAALKALAGSYMTRFGISFSYPVYLKQLTRLEPDFSRLTIGGQGQLPEPLDVIPQYRKIEAGDLAGAIAELEAMRLTQFGQLDDRLARMAGVLEWAIPRIKALR